MVALLLVAPLAAAQRPEQEEALTPVKAEVAVVASRSGVETEASTVALLTRKEIERLPARSLTELLRYLPSVDVRRRGPEGVQADVSLRGADYDGSLVLVDGEAVNDPQTNIRTVDTRGVEGTVRSA